MTLDVAVEHELRLPRIALLRRERQNPAEPFTPKPLARDRGRHHCGEEPHLVELPIETEPAVAPADSYRLAIRDRATQRIAHDADADLQAVGKHPQARGLPRAVVAHDELMPVRALDRILRDHLDCAHDPAIHEIDLELPLGPDELEASAVAGRLDFRNHTDQRRTWLHPEADRPRFVRVERDFRRQLEVLHAVESRRLPDQAGLVIDAAFLGGARQARVSRRPWHTPGFEIDVRHELRARHGELFPRAPRPLRDRGLQRLGQLGEGALGRSAFFTQRLQLGALRGCRDIHHRRRIVGRDEAFLDTAVEEREELVVVALRNRIELVIVAACAADGEAEPDGRSCLEPIGDILDAILLIDDSGFASNHVIAVETRRDLLLGGRVGQQVTGELLHGKLIEGHVAVECPDHPVAPRPDLAGVVAEEAVGIGVARSVEPVGRHAFAVARRGQQPIHGALVGVGADISQKFVERRRRRRQAGEVERNAAEERRLVGLGRKREVFFFEPGENETIDGILDLEFWIFDSRQRRLRWYGERPVRAILGALGDPAAQRGDLGGGERDVGISRRHPLVREPRLDPLDEFAQVRFARHDRDRAAAALGERLGAHVET